MDSKIHEIYERQTYKKEFNEVLMRNRFDIDWLKEKLNSKDYLKIEDYILEYSSKNDELLFELGFKYAWSLFQECVGKEMMGDIEKVEE